MPSFVSLHDCACVREQCNQWCGFALILLLWKSPPASFCSGHCMAAELPCEQVERVERRACALGVGRFGDLAVFPYPVTLCALSTVDGKGGGASGAAGGQQRSPAI